MEDEERLYIVAWESVHLDQICICTVSMANEWKKMLIHYWIFLFLFFFFLDSACTWAENLNLCSWQWGFFFNVYILSNKLLEDFLAILSSVWFTVISCIAIYWNGVFIFTWGRIWEYSFVQGEKKRLAVMSQKTF